jgi:rhodanese-related sulfurtransferase
MKKWIPAFAAVLMISSQCTPLKSGQSYESLPPAEYKKQLQIKKGILIDVRTPEEFSSGRIPGAMNIDYTAEDFVKRIQKLEHSRHFFVYCLAGSRSAFAAEEMAKLGFSSVYHLQGGITRWQKEGFDIISDENFIAR